MYRRNDNEQAYRGFLEASYYILPKYSDTKLFIVGDQCREMALTEIAEALCQSVIAKSKETLASDLFTVNHLFCENPLPEEDVYEIAERVYKKTYQQDN